MRLSAELFPTVFRLLPAGVAVTRVSDGLLIDVNHGFERILGYTRDEVLGKTVFELDLYENPHDRAAIVDLMRDQGFVESCETRWRAKSGIIVVRLSLQKLDVDGEPCVLTIFHDITDRKRIEAALRDSEERYRALTQSANDGIVLAREDGTIESWNKGAETMFGYSAAEAIGKSLTLLMPEAYHSAHSEGLKRFTDTGESPVLGKTVEVAGRRKDGSEFPIEVSLASWQGVKGTFFCGILRDISERKHAEQALREAGERLRSLSLTDELTGLNNRRGFLTFADEQLKLARRLLHGLSLVFIDVDGLKQVNDGFGHSAGDALLVAASRILQGIFRQSDVLARIGGDEFAALAVNAADTSADVIRRRLDATVREYNAHSDHPYLLSFSLGHVLVRPDVTSIEQVLGEADVAMYADKLQKKRHSTL